jgi:hypothetical protein
VEIWELKRKQGKGGTKFNCNKSQQYHLSLIESNVKRIIKLYTSYFVYQRSKRCGTYPQLGGAVRDAEEYRQERENAGHVELLAPIFSRIARNYVTPR